jgi:PAS domain S-box-containing protein
MCVLADGLHSDGLLQAAPAAVVVTDSQGRIVLVNDQAQRLFGYERDELLGRPASQLVPTQLRPRLAGLWEEVLAAPAGSPMGGGRGLVSSRRDGSRFPMEIDLNVLPTPAGPVVSVAVHDISERLRDQEERDRLRGEAERDGRERKAEQAHWMEALGQLAGGVAHDFNNVFGVIVNYATFVAEEIAELASGTERERWEAVTRDVAQIQRAAERATEVTRRLLAFGRRDVAQPRVLDVNQVVADLEQVLLRTLGEQVKLQIRPGPKLWPVLADPAQLEQVVVNLAMNARDAIAPGRGLLVVDTANVAEDTDSGPADAPAELYVRLRVSDTGRGMPKDVVDRAFEPFFTTKSFGQGAGLGLATVHGIVTAAGGHLQINSEPGRGTAISVLLPVTDQQNTVPAEQLLPLTPAYGEETVLLVEDQPALRELVGRILTRAGYQVLVAADANDAIAIAGDHDDPIHLLLTDVIMPQLLGKEVAHAVTDLHPSTRVVYMSGYARPVLASQGTLDPNVTLIEKPFSGPALLTTIRAVLDT